MESLHFCPPKEALIFGPLTKTRTHQLKFTKISFRHHSRHLGLSIRASSNPTHNDLDLGGASSTPTHNDLGVQKFKDKTIVVKYGGDGAAMKSVDLKASVVRDLVLLSRLGLRPVLIHGGRPEINALLNLLNIPTKFHDGLRVTDARTMEVVSKVLKKVNKDLVSCFKFAGANAVGLSDMDGCPLTARPSPNAAHLGFVGEVARVDTTVLQQHLDAGNIPVIASVAADEYGQPYNINADIVAGEVAAALKAEKLILLTDVAGILADPEYPRSVVKEIGIKGVKKMVEEGKVGGEMIPKVNCCIQSLAQGVTTVSIIDGRVGHSLIREIMTFEGAGTMITA